MSRLLLCDDHAFFLDALAGTLPSQEDEVVATTTDPDALIDLAQRHRPDVCIVDLTFSGREREELAYELKRLQPAPDVILLTASESGARWRIWDDGVVDGMVAKTSTLAAMREVLDGVRRGEQPVRGCERVRVPRQRQHSRPVLTAAESRVLAGLAGGASTEELQDALGVSQSTVKTHIRHIMEKLHVGTRAEAVVVAIDAGLLEQPV